MHRATRQDDPKAGAWKAANRLKTSFASAADPSRSAEKKSSTYLGQCNGKAARQA